MHLNVDAEFLADLAPQRLLGGLSGLHLAAGELPFATRIKARVASAGKVMIAVDNDGCHHVKHLQFGIEHASHSGTSQEWVLPHLHPGLSPW